MKRKLSIVLAFFIMAVCTAFAFNAYAEETTDSTDITPISITSENTDIKLNAASFIYNANEIKPIPTVIYTDDNGKKVTLTKGTDYDVSYSNNKNAGKATVKIACKNKYKGNLSKTFYH